MRKPSTPRWYRNPALILCGLGATLLGGGYWASRYVPMTEEEAASEKVRVQFQLALEAAPVRHTAVADALARIRAQSIRNQRTHPYRVPGLIAFYVGVALIVFGVVVWLRRGPVSDPDEDELSAMADVG